MSERQGYFVGMPTQVLDLLSEEPRLIQVYLLIQSYADKTGRAWPHQETLAERAGCTRKTINESIGRLVELEVLAKEERFPGTIKRDKCYVLRPLGVASKVTPTLRTKELEPVELEPNPLGEEKPARKIDPLWDALIEVFAISEPIPKSARGNYNGIVKELRQIEATPELLRSKVKSYRRLHPDWELTPRAVLTRWAELPIPVEPPPFDAVVTELYPGAQEAPVVYPKLEYQEHERNQERLRELSERFRGGR